MNAPIHRPPPPQRERKVIQIAATAGTNAEGELFALCDDGTVWTLTYAGQWHQLPAIPQPNGGCTK
jgi:hypothetical protein